MGPSGVLTKAELQLNRKKWGFLPTFFVKHYLKGGKFLKNKILSEKYNGPLNEPKKNLSYYFDLLISKIKLYKLLIFTKSI